MPPLSETMSDVHIPSFDRQLHDNYHSTDYNCQNFRIQPGVTHAEFTDFLRSNGWNDFAFITAYNPYSDQLLALAENLRQYQRLLAVLSKQGLTFLPASSEDREGKWPAEAGVILFDAGLGPALQLAASFEQNAILWGSCTTPPEILWTHGKLR